MAVCGSLLVILALLVASRLQLSAAGGGCPDEFEGECDCGFVPYGDQKRLTYVVNCTNSGFRTACMLSRLPNETEVLVFVGNEIKDLPVNIFGQLPHEKLHTIDLSDNHIQTIKGQTFHKVRNVTKLVLNDNDLYIVAKDRHPRMFSNFVNLQELHLRNAFTEKVNASDYLTNLEHIFGNSSLNRLRVLNLDNNEISKIHEGEFCSLPALEEIHLADNHLKDIPMNFSCLKRLKVLNVANNKIPFLSDETISSINDYQVQSNHRLNLNLTLNPFQCDCEMIHTYRWMVNNQRNLLNRNNFYCNDGFPPNIGKYVISILLSDLQCLPSARSGLIPGPGSAASIVLTTGIVCVFVLFVGVLYKHRLYLYTSMRRLFQPIRTKFNYVSLERRQSTMDV